MIQIPKQLLKQITDGENPQRELEKHLLNNYPINEIIKAFAELLITTEQTINRQPIVVTQEEYDSIISLFKIRGIKNVNGVLEQETRGRPKNKLLTNK